MCVGCVSDDKAERLHHREVGLTAQAGAPEMSTAATVAAKRAIAEMENFMLVICFFG